jgi:hypothetical protein
VITDLPPTLKWTLAIIAGGGAAGLTQGGTVLARAHSTAFTAAVGNPVVATVEVGGAIIMSLMSLIAPVIAVATSPIVLTDASLEIAIGCAFEPAAR